ncbi:hypothetical protein FRC12_001905 [Ceratobasidium sp. 428]|nr:hypothetical protein FRC12_001905 [Ceratobasidium sp. 428]
MDLNDNEYVKTFSGALCRVCPPVSGKQGCPVIEKKHIAEHSRTKKHKYYASIAHRAHLRREASRCKPNSPSLPNPTLDHTLQQKCADKTCSSPLRDLSEERIGGGCNTLNNDSNRVGSQSDIDTCVLLDEKPLHEDDNLMLDQDDEDEEWEDIAECVDDMDWEDDMELEGDTELADKERTGTEESKNHRKTNISQGTGNANPPGSHEAKRFQDLTNRCGPWRPYPNKAKLSILRYAKELGAKQVPSLHKLKKWQDRLRTTVGNPPQRHVSTEGNVFYLNEIGSGLAKDMSNPISRKGMSFYPHFDPGKMSQTCHGSKMVQDVPDELLSPTMQFNGHTYYVDELVQRRNGEFFIPKRWMLRGEDEKWCVGLVVKKIQEKLVVQEDARHMVSLSTFHKTYQEIATYSTVDAFADESREHALRMPHPLREIAGARPIYGIPVIVFMDDVSGAKSTQWNKHMCAYMSNAAIPRENLQSEFNIRFVTTSTHATPLELMQGIRKSFEDAFKSPIVAYDVELHEEVLLRPWPLFLPGDNPMQAEHCSCASLKSNFYCRTCHVGGTQTYQKSNEGYVEIFKSSQLRAPHETISTIHERLTLATQPNTKTKVTNAITATGIKDSLAQIAADRLLRMGEELREQNSVNSLNSRRAPNEVKAILQVELDRARNKGCLNPLLDMPGVNVHLDTPTEILHTILLGVVKYFWGQTVYMLDKNKTLSTFQSRLSSIETDGLNIPNIRADYICQYKGALVGKHFKTLSQVIAFTIYDLVSKDLLDGWLLIGRLVVLLWHTSITDLASYLSELQEVIDGFLDTTALCSPSILISKPKFHFLVHLPLYIKRFGPAILFSTERFEAFNAVFRGASIYSNRLAPSRDIATTFAGLDYLRHIATGGYWLNPSTGTWTCASQYVSEIIHLHPHFARLLGLGQERGLDPGSIVLHAPKRSSTGSRLPAHQALPWSSTSAYQLGLNLSDPGSGNFTYTAFKETVAESRDKVKLGCNVIFRSFPGIPMVPALKVAQVTDLLCCESKSESSDISYFAVLRELEFDETRHELLDMPKLTLTDSLVFCELQDLVCTVNLQHDCHQGQCQNDKLIPTYEEREITALKRHLVLHSNSTHFVLNTSSLHNYKNIQRVLPLNIRTRAPSSTYNRLSLRQHAAERIRSENKEKSAEKAKKAGEAAERAAAIAGSSKTRDVDQSQGTASATPATMSKQKGKSRAYGPEDTAPIQDLNSITLASLKVLGRMHGVSIAGLKADVIASLESFYALHPEERPNGKSLASLQLSESQKKRKCGSNPTGTDIEEPDIVPPSKRRGEAQPAAIV